MNFWDGKIACWEMRDCADNVCKRCPAYHDRTKPCWEIEDTLCDEILGTKKSCELCNVFLKYGGKHTLSENN